MLRRQITTWTRTETPQGCPIRTCLLVSALALTVCFTAAETATATEKASAKNAEPALHQPTEREIEEWIAYRKITSKALRDKITEVNDSYEIVFVPGILGSQLQIGSFTYGKDSIEARKLVFAPAQKARATTLNEFQAQIARIFRKDVDIYGQGLNDTQAANGGRALIEFAYDWRNDLDALAGDFDNFLQAQLPNKKFVIVAHSMGGVIAWHWKNKFNKPQKRHLIALVTLGSPLQGSCEAVRMLVEGYGPPVQSSSFEKWATHLVFGKAHPAVLTFPSVFALLPAYDEKQPCLKIRRGGQTMPLDHHEPGTWLGRPGGDYQLPSNFAAQAGLDARTYAGQVAAAIKAGRAFRQAFDSEPYEDQIYLLYADSHKLSSQTIVEPKGQNWLTTVSSGQEPGDGRVSRESAMNAGNFDARRGAAVTLERDHGGLLADPRFSSFLRDNIKRLMSQAKNAEILAFAETHGSLRDELKRRGWVADASLKTTALDRIPAIASAMKAHVDYNYELLASNKANPKFSGINFEAADRASTMIAAGNKLFEEGEADTAMALYSTGLAVREGAVPPTVLHRMAVRKLEQHQYSEAVEYGSRAEEAANRSDASLEERKLIGTNSALLGVAFEQTGSIRPAVKAYQKAAQHGSVEASKRLEALENKHMLQRRVEPEQSLHEPPPSTPAQDVPIPAPKTDSKSPGNQQSSLGQEFVPNNQARKTAPTPLPTESGPAAAPNAPIAIPLRPVAPLERQPAVPGGPHIERPVRRPVPVPNPVSPATPLPRRVPGPTLVPREQPSLRQPVAPRQLQSEPLLRRQQSTPNSLPSEAPLRQGQPRPTVVPREQPAVRQPVLPRQLPTEPPIRMQQPSSVSPQPRVLRQQPTPTLSPPEESTRHRPAVAAPLQNDEPVRRREVIPNELR